MDKARFELEKAVLGKKLPSNMYMFKEMGTPNAHLLIGARTNAKNVYTLQIMLNDFPSSVPMVYTTKPLKDRSGRNLKVSHELHNYGTADGKTCICHYPDESWSPRVSLYKVYIKCRLWLECYEIYLRTGQSIDTLINEINRQGGTSTH
ncbi:MAG: hypothetical protein J6L73_03675 [Muribaculaceae bacterium]|nr:hypothetical protein [Muribaculaceae bacterium]